MTLPAYVRKGKLSAAVGDFASYLFGAKAAMIVYTNAGAPVNGAAGTLFGVAIKGALLVDTTNGILYQNTNTLASPTWVAPASGSGAGAYTGTFDGVIGGVTPAAATFTTITTTGVNAASVANALTASVTQTRAGGLALTKRINRITVCANSGDAVTLPALSAGQSVEVYNDGANPAKVFPNGASDTIDGGAGGASVPLANAKRCLYTCVAANTIISAQLGAVSA